MQARRTKSAQIRKHPRLRKALKIVTIVLATILVVAGLLAISWTPKIRTPNGIAEMKYFDINGWKEWALIRGVDKIHNPLIFVVHGGPGMPANGYLRLQNSILEKYYTVVYWEQRGAGYSWDPKLKASDMSVDQFVSDLHELVGAVEAEIGAKPPVYILAFSWGTIVGLKFVQKYPELVHEYIGVGQVTNDARAETISRDYTLQKARADGNQKAIDELEAIGLPPYDYEKVVIKSDWARHYGAYSPRKSESVVMHYLKMLRAPEYKWPYLIKLNNGAYFSLRVLQDEIAHTNLFVEIPEVKVPVVFIEGKYDFEVPSSVAEEYYKVLKAPKKSFYYFDDSGHSVQQDEPEKFNDLLIELSQQ